MGQHRHGDTQVKQKIIAYTELIKKLDKKIEEYLAWLTSKTSRIYGFDAFDLLYRALAFRLTDTTQTLRLLGTVDKCLRELKALNNGASGFSAKESIKTYFKRTFSHFQIIFTDWDADLGESKKSIRMLCERYKNVETSKILAYEVIKDQEDTFADLKKHWESFETFQKCNDMFSHTLDQLNRLPTENISCNGVTAFLVALLSYGDIYANILTKEIEKYLEAFCNTEINTVPKKNINLLSQELGRIFNNYKLAVESILSCYYHFRINYETENPDETIVVTDLEEKKCAVTAKFDKIMRLISRLAEVNISQNANTLANGLRAQSQIDENEFTILDE